MTNYVKNIKESTLKNKFNLPNNFDIKNFNIAIERSFHEFLKSKDFKKLDNNTKIKDIQNKFNERLDRNLNKLYKIKKLKMDNTRKFNFQLQNFNTKFCLKTLTKKTKGNPSLEEGDLDIKTEEHLNKIFKKIENSKDFDPNSEKVLKDYIEKGIGFGVIKEVFNILWRFIKGGNNVGFSEFFNLSTDIKKLDLDNKSINELDSMINKFETQIEKTLDIKKDLKLTYILSEIKNKKLLKKNPSLNKKRLLQKNLKIGDVVLLNKKADKLNIGGKAFKAHIGSKALEAYDKKYDTDFTHSIIIIGTDPIKIRHSTMLTQKDDKGGHVEEVDLYSYLEKSGTKSFDVLALRSDEDTKQKILEFSEKKLGKKYDNNAALGGGLFGIDSMGAKTRGGFIKNKTLKKDDVYNCVEIIAQALEHDKLDNITHPNEFLEYMNIFQPTYMTTIVL
ncbi:MAG TPA: hypothetical protein PK674_01325 [Candidatus Absconditabacterales bacterium]|nr:hypothetical protein [Candidatus Absconditabacterales bacterium]HPK27818.1 hypothetical protein [Candidatus Absconditabacterales bacterium]